MKNYIKLIRPKQWVKNTFVFAPMLFVKRYHQDLDKWLDVGVAFLAFCALASLVYIFNDFLDREKDRKHSIKKNRPLASGAIQEIGLLGLISILLGILVLTLILESGLIVPALTYLGINLLYSLGLKNIPIIDLFCVSAGFLIRVYAGAATLDVRVSFWMFVTTLSVSLYLITMKRKQELCLQGSESRGVLKKYSKDLLSHYVLFSFTSTLIFYSVFVAEVRPELLVTVPFVLFGLFRFHYLSEMKQAGECPTETVTTDPWLFVAIIGWIISVINLL